VGRERLLGRVGEGHPFYGALEVVQGNGKIQETYLAARMNSRFLICGTPWSATLITFQRTLYPLPALMIPLISLSKCGRCSSWSRPYVFSNVTIVALQRSIAGLIASMARMLSASSLPARVLEMCQNNFSFSSFETWTYCAGEKGRHGLLK
jgi:hypothetical protein